MIAYLAGFGALLALCFGFLWNERSDWRKSSLALCAVGMLAVFAYLQLGAWRELRINELQVITMSQGGGSEEERRELLESLEYMANGNPQYGYLLGHRLLLEQEFAAARDQFAALRDQGNHDPNIDLSYVQSDFLAREGVLGPDARALAWKMIDSDNPVLLEIVVLDSLRANDQAGFLEVWPRYSATPRGAELAQSLGQSPLDLEAPGSRSDDETRIESGPRVQVELSASPGFDVPAETVIFVLVRDLESAGPPLAVKRLVFSDLPLTLALSDADAMLATRKLSQAVKVEVVARIAFSGGALAEKGDLEVASGEIELGGANHSVKLILTAANADDLVLSPG